MHSGCCRDPSRQRGFTAELRAPCSAVGAAGAPGFRMTFAELRAYLHARCGLGA